MSEYDDEESECSYDEDEECDDEYCEKRKTYYIEVQRTVRYTVRAHNDDEAHNVMWNTEILSATDPQDSLIDDFEDEGDDYSVESEAERTEANRRTREFHLQIEKELAAEDAAANVTT